MLEMLVHLKISCFQVERLYLKEERWRNEAASLQKQLEQMERSLEECTGKRGVSKGGVGGGGLADAAENKKGKEDFSYYKAMKMVKVSPKAKSSEGGGELEKHMGLENIFGQLFREEAT